ncbi:hypothetical protein CJ673_10455 [Aliarcobacter cryaerophilus]|uniref:WYL domain-containing protein n=1 Tax=Aliarcobacter cryaerophilus TaxID=28198 RepID=A0A2S9T0Z9_9BACT|nr:MULTISPECIES: hypothetical protein [Aliarcobacter]PRM92500.1 hypothetical protein CJ673_10455 [Aliarcobacter cryaerophilus]
MLEKFLQAIHEKKLVQVKFVAKSDNQLRDRKCVPFDYGASSTAKDKSDKYHFYDLNSPNGRHNLPLFPNQIREIKILENESFDPADYVKWEPTWIVERDWGQYS